MEVKNILNKCDHSINERLEALKKIPSSTCPACELERFNGLKAELKKKDELLFAYESVKAPVNPLLAENKRLREAGIDVMLALEECIDCYDDKDWPEHMGYSKKDLEKAKAKFEQALKGPQ